MVDITFLLVEPDNTTYKAQGGSDLEQFLRRQGLHIKPQTEQLSSGFAIRQEVTDGLTVYMVTGKDLKGCGARTPNNAIFGSSYIPQALVIEISTIEPSH